MEGEDIVSDRAVPLSAILKEAEDSLMYEYDIGDGWMHEIRLEELTEEEKAVFPPLYLDGQRSSPPEDCGAIDGYYEVLKVLADKKHPEYKEMCTSVERSFDPEKVDADHIGTSFRSIKRYIRNYETGNGL
ncbi:MAG: plasmid pRiA4b ORF-3 family protein [Bacteroidota bacterium]|nr:plasmid pRiA4b ORF-3 family protein [Bacteroidota bacterium]